MLNELSRTLKQRLSLPLPGEEAQFKMANAERRMNLARFKIPDNTRRSAVLILLYEKENLIMFPLIVRPVYAGVHSGQVALPGGSFDPADIELQTTALRETEEETGIKRSDIRILGKLTNLYIPPSNFLVTPFVGVHTGKPIFIPDSIEVARIVEMEVEKIMDEKFIGEKKMNLASGVSVLTPYYDLDGLTVWGATAMILSEFKSILYETGF
jgi:8-oxo-dGTP pyrophosphatase MutT (NUDIX family)